MVRPSRHSDEEILAVAREVFFEQGPGASLSAIAARLGLSQPALSQRFGSKRALMVRALSPRGLEESIAQLEAGPDDRPFDEQLRAIAVTSLEVLEQAVPSMITMRMVDQQVQQALADGVTLPHDRGRDAIVAFFTRARAAGLIRDVEPSHVAMMFVGSLQARALLAYVARERLDDAARQAQAAATVELLLHGIAPKEE